MYGRHGENPNAILAAATPSDCFEVAIEAVRIAVKYRMPVVVLTDGYLANGAEPWRLPDLDAIEPIPVNFTTDPEGFQAYARDPETLARNWAIPGAPGLEHRIGGLEKEEGTGNVSYDPVNHEYMCRMRADKVKRIVADIDDVVVHGDTSGLLLLSWGGTYGAVRTAVDQARAQGLKVGHVHLRWLNPFAANLESVIRSFDTTVVCELNLGQLATVLRSTYLVDVQSLAKIQGQPFKISEIMARIQTASAQGN